MRPAPWMGEGIQMTLTLTTSESEDHSQARINANVRPRNCTTVGPSISHLLSSVQ